MKLTRKKYKYIKYLSQIQFHGRRRNNRTWNTDFSHSSRHPRLTMYSRHTFRSLNSISSLTLNTLSIDFSHFYISHPLLLSLTIILPEVQVYPPSQERLCFLSRLLSHLAQVYHGNPWVQHHPRSLSLLSNPLIRNRRTSDSSPDPLDHLCYLRVPKPSTDQSNSQFFPFHFRQIIITIEIMEEGDNLPENRQILPNPVCRGHREDLDLPAYRDILSDLQALDAIYQEIREFPMVQ